MKSSLSESHSTALRSGPESDRPCQVVTDLAAVVGAVAYEGCIGETLSVVRAAAQLSKVVDPDARKTLETIVSDESRHAGLAWKTLRWGLKSGLKPPSQFQNPAPLFGV